MRLEYRSLPQTTFVPGLDLGSKSIYIDQGKLQFPGDLLHEAGHLAVTAARQRAASAVHQVQAFL
jgi:hypothetical protein